MLIGYARVSKFEQNLDLQTDALKTIGIEVLRLPNQAVECELDVYSGNFIYTGWITLTKDNLNPFKTGKITSFSIGGYERAYRDKYAKLLTPIIVCISELK